MENKYPKEYFELVNDRERFIDKPLKTKQLTYFQDAMVNFRATDISFATNHSIHHDLLAIFVPIFTPDRLYNNQQALDTLPPKVPLLEKLGIFDGKKYYKNQPIDYNTIDPETGLGYPSNFDPKFIDFSTLTNNVVIGSVRSSQYLGGTNELIVNRGRTAYSVRSPEEIEFKEDTDVTLDINSIGDGVVKLYISEYLTGTNYQSWNDLVYIGSINKAGVSTVSAKITPGIKGYLIVKYEVNRISSTADNVLSLNSLTLTTNGKTQEFEGYPLSQFKPFVVVNQTESGHFTGTKNEIVIDPEFNGYAVVSESEIFIASDAQIVLNIDSIGKGTAKVYLAKSNNAGDYESWDEEDDQLFLVGTTNMDGESTFSPFNQGAQPGAYYIVIAYSSSSTEDTENLLMIIVYRFYQRQQRRA